MVDVVTKARLCAKETDSQGYTTYVFKILDKRDIVKLGGDYIMCVRWPNWDHCAIDRFDEGYLSVTYIKPGEDTWYDPNAKIFVPYKTKCIQFNKFIKEQPDNNHDFIL